MGLLWHLSVAGAHRKGRRGPGAHDLEVKSLGGNDLPTDWRFEQQQCALAE